MNHPAPLDRTQHSGRALVNRYWLTHRLICAESLIRYQWGTLSQDCFVGGKGQ